MCVFVRDLPVCMVCLGLDEADDFGIKPEKVLFFSEKLLRLSSDTLTRIGAVAGKDCKKCWIIFDGC